MVNKKKYRSKMALFGDNNKMVAEALGMSVSNVYLSVSRCRNRLKKIRADVMKSDPEFYI